MILESALSRLRLCLDARLRKCFDSYKCIAKEYSHFHALVIFTYLLLTVLLETDKTPQSQRYLAIL